MRLISYERESTVRAGVVVGDAVFDLEQLLHSSPSAELGATASVREFLALYGGRLTSFSAELPVVAAGLPQARVGTCDDLRLVAPIVDPEKVLCIGLNYKDHVAETGRALPEFPDVFAKFATTMIGPYDEIGGAELTDNLDFEGELAVVIGRPARGVAVADALDYVAGLAVLNDVTARDLQYRGTQWLAGKAVDGSTPWGPELVTLDEIGDPQTLELVTRVNGVEMQRSNTKHQIFPIAEIIAYLTSFTSLAPGDVIATGTPEGIGAKRNPPVWLHPGDIVEIKVDRVGTLSNRVRNP